MTLRSASSEFTEKEFYLEEFRGRTLICAAFHEGDPHELRPLGEIARDLALNGTRFIVIAAGPGVSDDVLRTVLTSPGDDESLAVVPRLLPLDTSALTLPLLVEVWSALRTDVLLACRSGVATVAELVDGVRALAERLRVRKLIVVDPHGGIRDFTSGRLLSFANSTVLGRLLGGAGEPADRRPLLGAIHRVLGGSVEAVNVCAIGGVARELFTYEGAGTLCTQGDYCRVARLGVDDFHEVEKLLERGQREGYLKARSGAEIAEILFEGFGATIGNRHLAGVCALRTALYASHRAGEIVGLYTLTRFKGEGVGITLIESMKTQARERRLAYLFACTTQEGVGAFFVRQGFRRVAAIEVPPEKWQGYDPERQRTLRVYRADIEQRLAADSS